MFTTFTQAWYGFELNTVGPHTECIFLSVHKKFPFSSYGPAIVQATQFHKPIRTEFFFHPVTPLLTCSVFCSTVMPHCLSQRGFSPFVYRDRGGWPASLPYIRKIRVSVAMAINPESVFTKGYLWAKYGGPKKLDHRKVVKFVKVHFHNSSFCCCSSSSSSSVSTRVSQ